MKTNNQKPETKKPKEIVNTAKTASAASRMIFARNQVRSTDTRKTGLNNNVLVVGTSGCGKTGSFVVPNLQCTENSIVVADTKGQLYKTMRKELRERGFRTICIDFVHPEHSAPYNPLDAVQRLRRGAAYRETDLTRIANAMLPDTLSKKDEFWVISARIVLTSLMAFVLEVLPRGEQHFGSVAKLYRTLSAEVAANRYRRDWPGVSFFAALEQENPDSLAVKMYHMYAGNFAADKCWSSIEQFVSNALSVFDFNENARMLCRKGFDLTRPGREKIALFVNISDTDRSMDAVVNIFYTQLFQSLCRYADGRPDFRLPMPVHIILDDFAANVFIPDFDKLVSVIRSREISASIILQSLSQLKGMYNEGQASTIINNCDTMLYLGGQDVSTAKFFAEKAGRLPEKILSLDLDAAWMFVRGQRAALVEKLEPYSVTRKDIEEM